MMLGLGDLDLYSHFFLSENRISSLQSTLETFRKSFVNSTSTEKYSSSLKSHLALLRDVKGVNHLEMYLINLHVFFSQVIDEVKESNQLTSMELPSPVALNTSRGDYESAAGVLQQLVLKTLEKGSYNEARGVFQQWVFYANAAGKPISEAVILRSLKILGRSSSGDSDCQIFLIKKFLELPGALKAYQILLKEAEKKITPLSLLC